MIREIGHWPLCLRFHPLYRTLVLASETWRNGWSIGSTGTTAWAGGTSSSTETGWQVLGGQGGAEGPEVTHYFNDEGDARRMLQRLLETVEPELSNWAKMTASRRR